MTASVVLLTNMPFARCVLQVNTHYKPQMCFCDLPEVRPPVENNDEAIYVSSLVMQERKHSTALC